MLPGGSVQWSLQSPIGQVVGEDATNNHTMRIVGVDRFDFYELLNTAATEGEGLTNCSIFWTLTLHELR